MSTTTPKPARDSRHTRIRTIIRTAFYAPMIGVGIGAYVFLLMTR